MEPVRDIPFKVLLSHNPLIWREYVEGKTDIALTLSGHTHGMQMGVRLGKKRFCPSFLLWYRYPYGAGLYRTGKQYLYVNRGLGVIGFPGRIGMPPEITVITLLLK
jgi:predicted MPP superfamily phosphohydrolase